MSKEAIEFLGKINPSFKNMDINNTNTFGGEFLLYCIDKALNQGQSLPVDSVSKKDHEEALKIEYDKGYYKGTQFGGDPF